MKTSNPKVGMLTEMEYAKSKVISRKSTGLKVNRKDWNQGSISVKPNASGQVKSTITSKIGYLRPPKEQINLLVQMMSSVQFSICV
jgi:hypothetical protein